METKDTKKSRYIENRNTLKALSQQIKPLIKEGVFSTVNEGLIEIYKENNPEIKEFNTFWQWKDKGFTILKGSKAFLVWGQPVSRPQENEGSDEDEFNFFPLCYLFSNLQVNKLKG